MKSSQQLTASSLPYSLTFTFWNITDSCHIFWHAIQVLFGCLKSPVWWREGRASRSPLPIKKGNRWKQKKEISNRLLSHTHAFVIAVSQKNTHILQLLGLKTQFWTKWSKTGGYIVCTWNCLVKCQLVYAAHLLMQMCSKWELVHSLNQNWRLERCKNSAGSWQNSLDCGRMGLNFSGLTCHVYCVLKKLLIAVIFLPLETGHVVIPS